MTVFRQAKELASNGHYKSALDNFMWALDNGVNVDGAFVGVRDTLLLNAVFDLGKAYAPAIGALNERRQKLGGALRGAADRGVSDPDGLQLGLYVALSTRLNNMPGLLYTYGIVSQRLAVGCKYRQDFWLLIEDYLVAEHRYADAAQEHAVTMAALRFRLFLFGPQFKKGDPANKSLGEALDGTIEDIGGMHHEALIGAGKRDLATSLADELIDFRPTGSTFVSLIKSARRAGAEDVAREFHKRGHAMLPNTEHSHIDDAFGGVLEIH